MGGDLFGDFEVCVGSVVVETGKGEKESLVDISVVVEEVLRVVWKEVAGLSVEELGIKVGEDKGNGVMLGVSV